MRSSRQFIWALITACFLSGCASSVASAHADRAKATEVDVNVLPGYVRGSKDTRAERVIVFVHGLFGDGRSTWTNDSTGAYFPGLIRNDPAFEDADIWVHEFDTPRLRRSYTIDELGDHLRKYLNNDNVVVNHRQVVFICHSLGGLVVRAYLLKYHAEIAASHVPMIYFFGTPTSGSDLANIGRLISANPQLSDMRKMTTDDPGVLGVWEAQWTASDYARNTLSYCAYELLPTRGLYVVQRESARHLCNTRSDPIARDHISMVKPADSDDVGYISFRVAYHDTFDKTLQESRLPVWNLAEKDRPLLRVRNLSLQQGCGNDCWSDRVRIAPNDEIDFEFYLNNTGPVVARGTTLHLEVPAMPIAAMYVSATLSAMNTEPIFGRVAVVARAPILLIPTRVWWYDDDKMALSDMPFAATPSRLTGPGLSLGDLDASDLHHSVIARFRAEPVSLLSVALDDTVADRFSMLIKRVRDGLATDYDLSQPVEKTRGSIETGLSGEHASWIPAVDNISDDGGVIALISYYNNSDRLLRDTKARVRLTYDGADAATLRVTFYAPPEEERTSTAKLRFQPRSAKRLALTGAVRARKNLLDSFADMFDEKDEHDSARLFAVHDGTVDLGDIGPQTAANAGLIFEMAAPSEETVVEQPRSGLTNLNGRQHDPPVVQVGNAVRGGSWMTHLNEGKRGLLSVLCTFHNSGDVVAKGVRLKLGTAFSGTLWKFQGTVTAENAKAVTGDATIFFAPGTGDIRPYFESAYIYRADAEWGRTLDVSGVWADGLALGDLDPDESGSVQIFLRTAPTPSAGGMAVIPGQTYTIFEAFRNATGAVQKNITFSSEVAYGAHELTVTKTFRANEKILQASTAAVYVPWSLPNVTLRYKEAKVYTSMIGTPLDPSADPTKGVRIDDIEPGGEVFIRITYDVLPVS